MKKIKLLPLYDKVLVIPIETEEKIGNIVIPDAVKDSAPQIGIVEAVGHGAPLHDGKIRQLKVSVGDRVMFDGVAGIELSINNERRVLLQEEELFGIIK